ncbi:MAG: hypothetical protein ACTS9Y_00390 [Methylophilus sp.]|uniref:hypothetical protein n=1 Tax=Methylophilus sp. TaxID=29541 RepID=UPI003FA0E0FD
MNNFSISKEPLSAVELAVERTKLARDAMKTKWKAYIFMAASYLLLVNFGFQYFLDDATARFSIMGIMELSLNDKMLAGVFSTMLFVGYFGNFKYLKPDYIRWEEIQLNDFIFGGLCRGFLGAYLIVSLFKIYVNKPNINFFLFVSVYLIILFVTEKLVRSKQVADNKLDMYTYTGTDSIIEVSEYMQFAENEVYYRNVAKHGRVLVNGEVEAMKAFWNEQLEERGRQINQGLRIAA